jgi:hypothetical protein
MYHGLYPGDKDTINIETCMLKVWPVVIESRYTDGLHPQGY